MNLKLEKKNLILYKKDCEKEIRIYKNSLFNKERYSKHQIESFYKSIEILRKEISEVENKINTIEKLEILHFKINLPINILITVFISIIVSIPFDFYLSLTFAIIFIVICKNFNKVEIKIEKYRKEYSEISKEYFNPLGLSVLQD